LELDRVLGKALAKDAGERYQHVEDMLVDLRRLRAGLQQETKAERRAAVAARRRLILTASLAGLVVGVAGMGAWAWNRERSAPPPPVVRFSFDLPLGYRIAPTWNSVFGFSPDGQTLGYSHVVGGGAVTFLRRLDGLDVKPLTSAPRSWLAGFSPDGRYLMMLDGATMSLKKTALSGGAPVVFAKADMPFRGEWAPDDYYYWTDGYFAPISRTPISGGESEQVTQLDLEKQERAHRDARMLPGGRALTLTVAAGGMDSFDDARIDAYTLDAKKRKTLVQGGFSARYSPSGHLVYARGGNLHAVPFDAKSLEVTGPPFQVAEGVFMSTNSGSAYFDVSTTGALAYTVGKAEGGERTLVWVDRQGKATPLPLPVRSYLFPRVSPDGKRIAFEVEGVNHDFYIYDPERDVTTKMTTDGVSHAPVWTPDGRHLAYRSWKAGTMTMWWMPADRSAPEERLTTVGARQSLVSFSPDGRYATFNQMETDGTMTNLWMLPLTGNRQPQPFVRTEFNEAAGKFSPDGKWVAYCTNESGRPEVFVQPWPGPGPKIQISSEGGDDPIWSRDGRELFYRNGDKMMVVEVSLAGGFQAGKPRVLWESKYSHGMSSSCGPPGATSANYDVTGDGQRFLMVRDLDQDAASTRIAVVLNFGEELKRFEKEQKR
jgi:serine/threonine-protein kinase